MNTMSKLQKYSGIEELSFSVRALNEDLSNWKRRFDSENKNFKEVADLIHASYFPLQKEIADLLKLIENIRIYSDSQSLVSFYNRLRVCYSMYASLVTSLNWQSPAIKSSQGTRVGLECEQIRVDWNDYKRDRSSDTFAVEKYFKQSLLQCSENDTVHLFNSGMAAFTTILYFLLCEEIVKDKIMASSHIYVESKMILNKIFPEKVHFFETNNTEEILSSINTNKPSVVFIEPVSNTSILRLFDVKTIIEHLNTNYTEKIYLIIDTTCSFGFNTYLDGTKVANNIKIIVHGSILKAPQLGLERVNCGFVQGINLEEKSEKVLDYRTLSGTNIQDFATYLLPRTNKELLRRRLKIIEQNAIYLAKSMQKVDKEKRIISEVIYPALSTHPDHKLSEKIDFSGFFFNIRFVSKLNHDKYFEIFTKEVIRLAKARNSNIVHGASFGFNNSSIYYSVGWDEPENHYIRISTGVESRDEVKKIKTILIDAYRNFSKTI